MFHSVMFLSKSITLILSDQLHFPASNQSSSAISDQAHKQYAAASIPAAEDHAPTHTGIHPGSLHSNGIVGIADMDCPVFRQISIVSRSSEYSIHAKCVFVDWAGDLFAVHLTKKWAVLAGFGAMTFECKGPA